MRMLAIVAVCAIPALSLFFLAGQGLDPARAKPEPAAITFTAGTAKQWLEKEERRCVPAVLRDTQRRERSRYD